MAKRAKSGLADKLALPGFAAAQPFPHGTVQPLLDDADLRAVRKEALALPMTEKETDVFKLSQSRRRRWHAVAVPVDTTKMLLSSYFFVIKQYFDADLPDC